MKKLFFFLKLVNANFFEKMLQQTSVTQTSSFKKNDVENVFSAK